MKRRATTSALDNPRLEFIIIEALTPPPPPQNPGNIIQRLPGELQNKIFNLLTYTEAVRLSSVSQYFHDTIKSWLWPDEDKKPALHDEDKKAALYDAQHWDRYNKAYFEDRTNEAKTQTMVMLSDGYACFSCFRILDKSCFSRNQTERRNGKASLRFRHVSHHRFCIECGIKKGKHRTPTFLKAVTDQRIDLRPCKTYKFKEFDALFVCPRCNESHEYIDTALPEICKYCESAQVEFDESAEALAALEERRTGYYALECQGCKLVTEFRKLKKSSCCSGCDGEICKTCGGAKSPDEWECECDFESREPEDDYSGFARLFQLEGEKDDYAGDIFEGEGDNHDILAFLASDV